MARTAAGSLCEKGPSCAEGQLFTWGDGVHGRLGHGDMEPCPEPRLVTSLQHRRVLNVSCGYYHSAAICCDASMRLTEGTLHHHSANAGDLETYERRYLYTWGGAFEALEKNGDLMLTSNHGCLGLPGLQQHEGTLKPHAVELGDVHDVACGMNFTVAIDGNGSVFQMGSMLYCGPVDGAEWEATVVPTRVRGALDGLVAKQVTAGRSHACVAAAKDGGAWSPRDGALRPNRLVTWGNNEYCQLGRVSKDWALHHNKNGAAIPIATRLAWATPEVMADRRGAPVRCLAASVTATVVVLASGAAAAAPRAPRRGQYRTLHTTASMPPMSAASSGRQLSQAMRSLGSPTQSSGSPYSSVVGPEGLRSTVSNLGPGMPVLLEGIAPESMAVAAESLGSSSSDTRRLDAWRGSHPDRPKPPQGLQAPPHPMPASPLPAGRDDVNVLASRVEQLERLLSVEQRTGSMHGAPAVGPNRMLSMHTQGESLCEALSAVDL
jgi:hypothetical protein